jgi:hypothetical protein
VRNLLKRRSHHTCALHFLFHMTTEMIENESPFKRLFLLRTLSLYYPSQSPHSARQQPLAGLEHEKGNRIPISEMERNKASCRVIFGCGGATAETTCGQEESVALVCMRSFGLIVHEQHCLSTIMTAYSKLFAISSPARPKRQKRNTAIHAQTNT